MAPKSKSSKKSKSPAVDASPIVETKADDPISVIIKRAMKSGYTRKEVESTFDLLWSQGMEIDDVEKASEAIVNHMKDKSNDKGSVPERKEDSEKRENSMESLERKLQQVISLQNVNDVLDGLVRWYNSTRAKDRSILLSNSIIEPFLMRTLHNKTVPINAVLLQSFFATIYSIPSEVSNALTESYIALQGCIDSLPMDDASALRLFLEILENCSAHTAADASQVLTNLLSMKKEAKQAYEAVEGEEPKSQFQRRDLSYKSIQLSLSIYETLNEMKASGKTIERGEIPVVQVADRIPASEKEDEAIREKENVFKKLQAMQEASESQNTSLRTEKEGLLSSIGALSAKRDALRKELDAVESQLVSQNSRLTEVTRKMTSNDDKYRNDLSTLDARYSALCKQAASTEARCRMIEKLGKVQELAKELVNEVNLKGDEESVLIDEMVEYMRFEKNCIDFLERRMMTNNEEMEESLKELSAKGHSEERTQQVAKLRRMTLNDGDAIRSLKSMCEGVEKKLSAVIESHPKLMTDKKECIASIYTIVAILRLPISLSTSLFSIIQQEVESQVPKPVMEVKKTETKEKSGAPLSKPVVPVTSGKKWNVTKQTGKAISIKK